MKLIGQQGEVKVYDIASIPSDATCIPVERCVAGFIISHSESGHHHVIPAHGDVEVMERTDNVPPGMRIIYAIVKDPTMLIQDAPTPHDVIALTHGVKMFRIQREFNPFLEEARRVAD